MKINVADKTVVSLVSMTVLYIRLFIWSSHGWQVVSSPEVPSEMICMDIGQGRDHMLSLLVA